MKRLLIVDGSNLLFQMFYGMPARIVNEDGKAIQGTLGFVGAFLKMVRMVEPTHVVVLFDGEHRNPRNELDSEYKANRPDYSMMPEEDTPFSQLPDIRRALEYLDIHYAETTCCETDDWVASYVSSYKEQCEIFIVSFDSDFFQLIGDTVFVLRYRGDKTQTCTSEYIREKFEILPCQYADWKALVGDTADHIKGIEKIGPKTASALLQEYGTLREVLHNAERIKKKSVRDSMMKNIERAQNNYRLIKLNGGFDLPFVLDELKYVHRAATTVQILQAIGLRK